MPTGSSAYVADIFPDVVAAGFLLEAERQIVFFTFGPDDQRFLEDDHGENEGSVAVFVEPTCCF